MTSFSKNVLDLDLEAKAEELARALKEAVLVRLKRRGLVVGVSGGIDSACVAALGVRALGKERVFAVLMPERDSSDVSTAYGRKLCDTLGVRYEVRDIAPALEALDCYRAREEAVRSVFPAFTSDMKWKMVLHADKKERAALNVMSVVIDTGRGVERVRLTHKAYLQIVAATNYKQRVRKVLEYHYADLHHFAASGTPNRLEYDQGFFVKLGDGAADVKPIAGLYKTQVYALARHLGVIDEIVGREPTTDTYSLDQSQEDFYFSVPYRELDLILWAKNHGVSLAECGAVLGMDAEQVGRVYEDIDQKRRTTAYLHRPPILLEEVAELAPFAV